MIKTELYKQTGEKIGMINLPEDIFGLPWNGDLVHQVLRVQLANRRKILAHTKTRAEVRGGGRKPWRQKGTGRARHGSIRSPIWRGGGVTFGPLKVRVFKKKINKKMNRKAILMVLSRKLRDKEILILETLNLKEAKTKFLKDILAKLPLKRESAILALAKNQDSKNIFQAARNLKKITVMPASNLNVLDMLNRQYLILTKKGLAVLIDWLGKEKSQAKEEKLEKAIRQVKVKTTKAAKKSAKAKTKTKEN